MKIFKTPLTPRGGEERILEYIIREDLILKVVETELNIVDGQDPIPIEKYYDLSILKDGITYVRNEPVVFAKKESGEIRIEVQNFLLSDATHEERFPEWKDVEFEDFEIPEDAEIIQLEELVIPEFEEPEDPTLELQKANEKIARLEKYVNDTKAENEALVLSAIEIMTEMMLG